MDIQDNDGAGVDPKGSPANGFRSRSRTLFNDLAQNIRAGLTAVFYRKVTAADFRASADQITAFVVLDLVVSFILSFAKVGGNGFFDYYALPQAVFYLPLVLASAYVISTTEKNRTLSSSVPVAIFASSLPIMVIIGLLEAITANQWIPAYSAYLYGARPYLFVWWFTTAYSVLLQISRPAKHKWLIGLTLALFLLIPLSYIPKADLWVESYGGDEKPDDYYTVVREDAFYAQPELLNHEIKALRPHREGRDDIYFVSFAGQSNEDVFMNEAVTAKKLFDERFGTAGRSIALINNPKTIKQNPIASRTALSKTLRHIGKIMDPEEDVLFLYLTSHGSKEGGLSVYFWPLELNGIDPAWLKLALAESGIKWRILAISACFSGTFVEPLKDDRTLIFTASDADHTSFGCGKESDFTYFGKAFFDEELRRTNSFTTAFEKARKSITERELSEGKTPSNPQLYVGPSMRRKLDDLEARLRLK